MAQLKEELSDRKTNQHTNINIVTYNRQTPTRKSIATPTIPNKYDYDVINFNDVMNATGVEKDNTIISNGIIRRPTRSPHSDSFSDYGDIGNNTPYINNLGRGNGSSGNGGGDDAPGDSGNGSGKGTIGKGFGYGNKRVEFTLVKSSNITISIFSGSNLNAQPYLIFYKSIKRLIYNQGSDGEQLLEILEGVEKFGAIKFDNAKLQILLQQYPKAAEYNRGITSLLLN